FISVGEPPFPAYTFGGENLATDDRVEIRIEDHYWDDSDAAVVFERRDTATGERRYIYHGNDGTSFPWNDTAQLDFLQAEVREVVIRTILDVAHRFPVIRFDAAMVLAKKHVERLWYPEPGAGGAIPSRAEHAMTKARFDKLMPDEFWREVVDRVAAEAPDTLLLAEAFWLLEGYFVRTLGMHRVYNSAFMHMIRDEDNAGYRKVIRDTVEFDPAILGRYVNFLTNPDEETAIEQFGTGDKYFGAATLLATLPGLPMIGHGQIEGFTEKYGMEFRRARLDELPNAGLIGYFEAQIVPLLRERRRFAGSADFRLYDVVADGGSVVEDVFAYSNGRGDERSLIVYHNRFGEAAGWIRESVAFALKHDDGTKTMRRDTLADAIELHGPADGWLRFRDRRSGLESLRSVGEIRDRGLHVELGPYECFVLDELRELVSTAEEPWAGLAGELRGRAVPSLDEALADHRLRPVHAAVGRLLVAMTADDVVARREELAAAVGIRAEPTTPTRAGKQSRGKAKAAGSAAAPSAAGSAVAADPPVAIPAPDVDPAARAAVRLRPLLRATFDAMRISTALRAAGLDSAAIERTRIGLELAHPMTTPDAGALATSWLTDPDVRAFLQVHDWDGVEWLVRERWVTLVRLADALDRASGAKRASPAIARLLPAAEAALDRVDGIMAALPTVDTKRPRRRSVGARATRTDEP
ncbi:MAG TPA: alpha-amylase, partial [Verrucomicrobiae bacterium]|nr:alpha-amylase [Verrucomicrobiae bacterium]